jgi:uncharacterized delta-60 repeat protein
MEEVISRAFSSAKSRKFSDQPRFSSPFFFNDVPSQTRFSFMPVNARERLFGTPRMKCFTTVRHRFARWFAPGVRGANVLFASATMLATLATSATSNAQTAGSFDTTFGVNGRITNITPANVPGNSVAYAMAVQPDGKILLVGGCADDDTSVRKACIARLLATGQLDTSFTGPSGNAAGKFYLPIDGTSASDATAVVVQADGKIVIALQCQTSTGALGCMVRLRENGAYDASFDGGVGGAGRFTFRVGDPVIRPKAVLVQSDGKIVVLTTCEIADAERFCLARFNANGTFDGTFDGPDATGVGVGSGNGRFALMLFGVSAEYPRALALTAEGKLVASGVCAGPSGSLCVVRLNTNGSYDSSFDGPSGSANGRIALEIGGLNTPRGESVAVQPDGKIVVVGFCNTSTPYRFCGARLTTSGAFDPEFVGISGNTPGRFTFTLDGNGNEMLQRIAIQTDGRILLAGHCENGVPNTNGYDFCFARLNSDGSFDSSFDGPSGSANGRFRIGIANDMDTLNGLAVLPNGKILAGGTCSDTCGGSCGGNGFCVARFHGGSQGYETCSLDIDGDGVIGVTDALIHARVALGFTGAALLDGLSFAANALRTTSNDVRNHLISQCGMVSL